MNIYTIFFIAFFRTVQSKKIYPTPRWITICKSSLKNESNATSWYKNKSTKLSCFLKDNLETLYM